jgi:DNA topoisomerase VI subunit B
MAKKEKVTAEQLAKGQRTISVADFFVKNRHLLGFDNPRKALLTSIKEFVDNSLDACEEAHILPDIYVEVKQITDDRFRIIVEDNGPGIVKAQIPKIFAKLLYGSKFYKPSQKRGQQGIGASASVMYAQLTTGKAVKITSKTDPKNPAHYYELHIDTSKNEPHIITDKTIEWNKDHGVKVELELEAKYQKGRQSVDEYLKQTAVANPHTSLTYKSPDNQTIKFPRVINELPKEPKEIKPHPYGVEVGRLMNMLKITKAKNIASFLTSDFSRVSSAVASKILEQANISKTKKPLQISPLETEKIHQAIQKTKIMAPPTDCLSPIGEEQLIAGLKKEIKADFYVATTRPTSVYRGNPFSIEAAIAYGGEIPGDQLAKIYRFANKVPLLYQQSACSVTKSITNTAWKNYHISQSKGALPSGPLVVLVHIASVWVPFTSESKEAIAHYPEIIKEIKLALQDCGRKLNSFIRKTVKVKEQKERLNLFEKYIPEVSSALSDLTGSAKKPIEEKLSEILKKSLTLLNNQANVDKKALKKENGKPKKEEQSKLA